MKVILVSDDGAVRTLTEDEQDFDKSINDLLKKRPQKSTPVSGRIARMVSRRRKTLGLTLQQLSNQTQISVGYLSQIEHGAHTPTIDMLERLGRGLQIPLVEFFDDES